MERNLPDAMKSIAMKINTPLVNYFDLAENPHTRQFCLDNLRHSLGESPRRRLL